mmetsp:Transcript_131292/g.365954  ORF Transcript_131292/g.365954 Transcript_131292/m.365954 type:complete len:263 (+) Transcript_131292:198-986(+)
MHRRPVARRSGRRLEWRRSQGSRRHTGQSPRPSAPRCSRPHPWNDAARRSTEGAPALARETLPCTPTSPPARSRSQGSPMRPRGRRRWLRCSGGAAGSGRQGTAPHEDARGLLLLLLSLLRVERFELALGVVLCGAGAGLRECGLDVLHVGGEVRHVVPQLVDLFHADAVSLLLELRGGLLHRLDSRQGDPGLLLLESEGLDIELRAQELVSLCLIKLLPLDGLHGARLGGGIGPLLRDPLAGFLISLGNLCLQVIDLCAEC